MERNASGCLEACQQLQERGAGYGVLCRSAAGRPVPLVSWGNGNRCMLYIGAHHGSERITAGILLRFLEELTRQPDSLICGVSTAYLARSCTFLVVPMLNPDGVDISLYGADAARGFAGRVAASLPDGSFLHWQANARGVDLNHNYPVGFSEYKVLERASGICPGPTRYSGTTPLSEPESSALARLIRLSSPALILTLHSQGEEIFAGDTARVRRGGAIARQVARLSGYRLVRAEGEAAYGGLTDWTTHALGIPSFTVECGRGENPLPAEEEEPIYTRLRPLLFRAPLLR